MKDDELRLECVKLAHHQGRDMPFVLERAEQLYQYVKRGPSSDKKPGTSSES